MSRLGKTFVDKDGYVVGCVGPQVYHPAGNGKVVRNPSLREVKLQLDLVIAKDALKGLLKYVEEAAEMLDVEVSVRSLEQIEFDGELHESIIRAREVLNNTN